MAVDISRLTAGSQVRLPGRHGSVTLVNVSSGPFWDLIFRDREGRLDQLTLAEAELGAIEVLETDVEPKYDGEAIQFRLGIEARRIQLAFSFDMAAVAVSNIQPLPHQLDAVYGRFLRQPRLRFLLADDPGAGKTIMTGLYMKELELRHAGDRILVVTPASLRPQWTRELEERFNLRFRQVDSTDIDNSPTSNPWDEFDRVVVSRDFLRTQRARELFTTADKPWDLAVIDEAHGFTLAVDGQGLISRKSERYKAAEEVARRSNRLILLTATPHSGRDESLWGLLRLLDPDAWGDRCPQRLTIPDQVFRKVSKEAMRDMTGAELFKPRHPRTLRFTLEGEELALYEAVTDFVAGRLSELRAEGSTSAAGFALTTMQRRVASSVRALRRTLERRLERLDRALADPASWLRHRQSFRDEIDALAIDDGEDVDEARRWELEERALEASLPTAVADLEAERAALRPVLVMAERLEARGTERKLTELLRVVDGEGLRGDQSKKLLIFTEHKDTLDYLVEKLSREWRVATIHGGLRLSERIEQERYFRESAQLMVATEAAGEGINLQFCNLMVNYDIPWNPNRLEQRMGRIHRIGQTRDAYIFNLVAANTREGKVLDTLLTKLENMALTMGDRVFDVIGSVFAGYRLRELIEEVLLGEVTSEQAAARIGADADPATVARARELLSDALAKHHIDWQVERSRADRAEERRLPAAHFERFFMEAIQFAGGRVARRLDGSLRVERTPDLLVVRGQGAAATRRISPKYERLTFDKTVAALGRVTGSALPPVELCGPGHPLFDALLELVVERTGGALAQGAMLLDPDGVDAAVLHFLVGEVLDGTGQVVHRALRAARRTLDGRMAPTSVGALFDLAPPSKEPPTRPDGIGSIPAADDRELVMWARQHLFEEPFQRASAEREHVARIQEEFLRRSFNHLIAQADNAVYAAEEELERQVAGAEGRLRRAELAKRTHEIRRDQRLEEVARGRTVTRGPVRVLGSALLIPVRVPGTAADGHRREADPEIERLAVALARRYEEGRGARVTSVEADRIGFDLISELDHERRCIEVKGRAGVGRIELTWSELAKSQELGRDYWLYVALDCAGPRPRLYRVQDPARALAAALHPKLDIRYQVEPEPIIAAAEEAPA